MNGLWNPEVSQASPHNEQKNQEVSQIHGKSNVNDKFIRRSHDVQGRKKLTELLSKVAKTS